MTNDSRPYTCARGNPPVLAIVVVVVVIRASGLVVARTFARARVYTCMSVDRGLRVYVMYICSYVCMCVSAGVGRRSVGLRTNPLDIPRPSERYGCLFNMCNRQRAQIQSIKSINDSIVRSRCDTCASSWIMANDMYFPVWRTFRNQEDLRFFGFGLFSRECECGL